MAVNEKRIIVSGISLRRDSEANYALVGEKFIPKNGEVCLVDTELYGLRAKIGDGATAFAGLKYSDEENNVVLIGYYLNNKFYTDSTYTVELEKNEKHTYIDKNSKGALFIYNGDEFAPINPIATESVAGLVKLYQTHGNNTDGTMSQKAITDGVNSISLELDENDSECLVLDLPWD